MPPLRSFPMKTERTHEENQERAYIAASRRSDRSLEARIESARRASEIHKRRTGRSLRVTEQDVVNEEMYEEEDDDLPRRFQGIPQHLKTQDEEYNKKLHAYLVHTMVMRQAVSNTQQYGRQYGGYGPSMFSAPMMGIRPGPQANAQVAQMSQRHQPYPTANTQTASAHRPKSASISTPTGISPKPATNPQPLSEQPRRSSNLTPSNSHSSGSSESVEQDNDSLNMDMNSATARIPPKCATSNLSSSHMTAPISLSQEVYPGVEHSYSRIFTNELPQNVQMMGFPTTSNTSMNDTSALKNNNNKNDFGSSTNATFGYNNHLASSNDGLKRSQHSYTGRTALDVTLPYMPNGSQNDSNTSSMTMNFARQTNLDNSQMGFLALQQESNFDDAWDSTLYNDSEFTDYEGSLFALPMGSQEGVKEES